MTAGTLIFHLRDRPACWKPDETDVWFFDPPPCPESELAEEGVWGETWLRSLVNEADEIRQGRAARWPLSWTAEELESVISTTLWTFENEYELDACEEQVYLALQTLYDVAEILTRLTKFGAAVPASLLPEFLDGLRVLGCAGDGIRGAEVKRVKQWARDALRVLQRLVVLALRSASTSALRRALEQCHRAIGKALAALEPQQGCRPRHLDVDPSPQPAVRVVETVAPARGPNAHVAHRGVRNTAHAHRSMRLPAAA